MAYRVNNVEYVNSSGQFSNQDLFRTVHGNSLIGTGNIDTSPGSAASWGTSHNSVGSLITGFNLSYSNQNAGDSVAGSSLYHFVWTSNQEFLPMENWRNSQANLQYQSLGGTWRSLNYHHSNSTTNHNSFFCRIS